MRGNEFTRQGRITRATEARPIIAFPLNLSFPYSFDKENKHKRIHGNVGALARDRILVRKLETAFLLLCSGLDTGLGTSLIKGDISRADRQTHVSLLNYGNLAAGGRVENNLDFGKGGMIGKIQTL